MSRPDYFEMNNGHRYHSVRQLLARRWSLSLIADELGAPDVVQETSWGDRKLYLKHWCDVTERDSLAVVTALHEYWSAKATAAKAKAKRLAERFEYLEFWSRNKRLMKEVEQMDYD